MQLLTKYQIVTKLPKLSFTKMVQFLAGLRKIKLPAGDIFVLSIVNICMRLSFYTAAVRFLDLDISSLKMYQNLLFLCGCEGIQTPHQ